MVSAAMALRTLRKALENGSITDAAFEAREIFREITGKHPLSAEEISGEQLEKMEKLAARRVSGEPLQYLFGKWEFYGLPFYVGEGVLIPRPETELLAGLAINACKNGGRLLDLCSGSGCIAVAAAKNSAAQVYAVEKYPAAFTYLERNIAMNKAEVTAVQADALDGGLFDGVSFDMIVSNPPYLTAREMSGLQKEVRHEPETALYGGEDGLDFYRTLIPLWKGHLSDGGVMAFEVGDAQAEAVSAVFEKEGFCVEVIPDLQGIGRIVKGNKKAL